MRYVKGDFELVLIDEPLQKHVVAWERAENSLKTQEVKPRLLSMLASLKQTSVADKAGKLTSTLTAVVEDLSEALNIIETNATETISTRCDVIVKAALHSGWIVSPELTDEQIDNMKPWLVQWIAGEIVTLYNEATSIPKN